MSVQWRVLSPYLREMTGHEAEYVERFTQAAKASGDLIEIILPIGSQAKFTGLEVRLSLRPPEHKKPAKDLIVRTWQKAVRIINKFQAHEVYRKLYRTGNSASVWLLHTVSYEEAEVALRAFTGEGRRKDIGQLKVILRADHQDDPLRIRQLSRVLGLGNSSTRFYADTFELAENLSALTVQPVYEVPIPGVLYFGDKSAARKFRLGYFGLRRQSKGFDRLPDIVAALPMAKGASALHVFVHGSAEVDEVEDHSQAEESLRAMGVFVTSRRLSSEEYESVLVDTEVVLMPYSASQYRYGSSGVFVDALKAGCSVVVPIGTWMAKEARRHGLSRVFEVDFTDLDRVRDTVTAALNDRLRPRVFKAAEIAWLERNSPMGLFQALIRTV